MSRVVRFYALALAISWIAWLPLVARALGWIAWQPSPYLHLAGGFGPAIAALVVARHEGRGSVARLLARCVRGPWYWVALAAALPLVVAVVVATVLAIGGASIDLWSLGTTPEFPALGVVGFTLANIVCYGFGEELGWRGFLLPRLQTRASAATASLIVAAMWALWHLPLFAFSGMSAMGAGAMAGWLASIVAGSFLMTALFNASRGSVLACAMFHGVLDIVMTAPTGAAMSSTLGVIVTVAGFVVAAHHVRIRRLVCDV